MLEPIISKTMAMYTVIHIAIFDLHCVGKLAICARVD